MHPYYSRELEPRHLVILQLTVVLAFAALGLAAYLIRERDATLTAAEGQAHGAARLMEEYFRRTVEAADLALATTEVLPPADRVAGAAAAIGRLPEALAVIIADADGSGLAVGNGRPPRPAAVGGEPYFTDLRQMPASGPHIGLLRHTRFGDQPAFMIGRALADSRGRFAGATVVVVSAARFVRMFHGLRLGPGAALDVFDARGAVVLHLPAPDAAIGRNLAGGAEFGAAAGRTAGVFHGTSSIDGVERVGAVQAADDLGLAVAAGLAMPDLLAPWRSRARMAVTIFAVLALAAIGMARLAYRGMSREQAIMRRLEDEVRLRTREAQLNAEEARRAEATKSRFLATASHDLRQPLQAMEMFAEVLGGRLSSPAQMQVFTPLRTALHSANQLLTTLLDASALEAGKIVPVIRTFPLTDVFARLAPQIAPLAEQKALSFTIVDSSAGLTTDPTLLERMLRNLLVNAVRYTPRGGVLLGCRRADGHVVIQVVDTGAGIPADKLTAVFEDFNRLDTSCEGRGLGLGVVRKMAELLELDLSVASAPGRGTVFGVRVPLATPDNRDLCLAAAEA